MIKSVVLNLVEFLAFHYVEECHKKHLINMEIVLDIIFDLMDI